MLVPTGAGQSLTTQTFRVSSLKVKCLLSETDVFVNLDGYCAYDNMLQYQLDQNVALVLASAVDINPETQEKTFTVEKVEKGTTLGCCENFLGPGMADGALELHEDRHRGVLIATESRVLGP